MLLAALGALAGSFATAYLLGCAFIAPRESFLRTKAGVWMLVLLVSSVSLLPPQLTALGGSMGQLSAALPGIDLSWPSSVGRGVYLLSWAITSLGAALIGARVWNAGKPGWRQGVSASDDTSTAARLRGLLPLADSLPEALDTLGRVSLGPKDAERAAAEIRDIGRRFAAGVPARDGDVYSLVSARLPAAVAARVTGYLIEGARPARSV